MSPTWQRRAVLLLCSLFTFGSYFAYDSVGAIETSLLPALSMGREAVGILYSVYSVAAVVSVPLGGILIDRFGARRASLLFSALVTTGAALVGYSRGFGSMCLGRFVFGCGSESLVVAQNAILARWFAGRRLAFVLGLALALSRLGTILSFNTEARIAAGLGFRAALHGATVLCAFCLLANLAYSALEVRAVATGTGPAPTVPEVGTASEEDPGGRDTGRHFGLHRFPAAFWLLSVLCTVFYSSIFPFTALSTDLFHEKWGLPLALSSGGGFWASIGDNVLGMFITAPGTSSLIMLASLFLAPAAGYLMDRTGWRTGPMLLGALLLVPSFLLLAFTRLPPALPMLLLAIAFVLVPATIWPAVPRMVPASRVGTAYGLMTMMQNLGLAVMTWANGKLRDTTHSYVVSLMLFAALGAVGVVCAVLLRRTWRSH